MEKESNGLVHIIWSLNQGGAERFCIELANCSTDDSIIVAKHCDNALDYKSNVVYLEGSPLKKLSSVFRITKGKVVFIWMYKSYLFFALLQIFRPLVLCIHHDLRYWQNERITTRFSIIISLILQRLLKTPCIFVSEASLKSHERIGFDGRVSKVIYNGVKDNNSLIDTSLKRTMIYVGRKDPIKNVDLAFNISVELLTIGIVETVTFVGTGLDIDYRNELVEKYNVSKSVSNKLDFLGFQKNLDDLYEMSDLLLLSSHSESCPMSVIEAARSGLAIASTDVGDVRIMIHKDNVFYDSKENAVEGISTLFSNPNLMFELKKKNRRIFEDRFDLERVRRDYEESAKSLFSSK